MSAALSALIGIAAAAGGTDPSAPAGGTTYLVGLIITVVGGGVLSIIGSLLISRRGQRVPETTAARPVDFERREGRLRSIIDAIKAERDAARIFIALHCPDVDPRKVKTGYERLDDVRPD